MGIVFDTKDIPLKGKLITLAKGAPPRPISSIDVLAHAAPEYKKDLDDTAYEYNRRYSAWAFWVVPTNYGGYYLVSERRL